MLDLFGEDWLQDSNCVGSSIAALGREDLSDWSSSWVIKPSKRYAFGSVSELQITERPCSNNERDGSERQLPSININHRRSSNNEQNFSKYSFYITAREEPLLRLPEEGPLARVGIVYS